MDNNTVSNYSLFDVRTAAILTNSYVSGTVIGGTVESQNLFYNNQLIIEIDFTIGSLTNVIIMVEFSTDGITWFQQSYEDIAAATGVSTLRPRYHLIAATGKYRFEPITICEPYIRISASGTGTVTSSSLAVKAIIGKI